MSMILQKKPCIITDTLFLTASQPTVWNASYKSRTDNANVVATSAIPFTNAVLKADVVAHYDGSDGTAKDGEISEAEALLVTAINVSGGYDTTVAQSGTKTKIASFADIANFPNLDTLDCALNSLTSLDVSKNTMLTYLACCHNQLTSLDVSANTSLTQLSCNGNRLTRLDARTMAAAEVYCGNQDINGDGSPSTAETDTLFLTASQLTKWNASYKSNTDNANVVAYGFVTLALAVNDTAMGEVTGAGTYVLTDGKASVKIAATAKTGYAFSKWSDGDTSASRTVTIGAKDTALTATFAIVAYKLAL